MKRNIKKILVGGFIITLAVFTFTLSTNKAEAVLKTAATGNWNTGAVWTPVGVPLATDDVIIPSGILVDLNIAGAVANSILLEDPPDDPGSSTGIFISSPGTLTVTNAVTFTGPTGDGTSFIIVSDGILSAGSLAINDEPLGAGNSGVIIFGTGAINIAGDISFGGSGNAANRQLISTGSSAINIGGNLGDGGFFAPGTSTVTFNGTGAQGVGAYTYHNVVKSGAGGTASLTGATNIGGTLSVTTGTFAAGANSLTVTGATTVAAGGALSANTLALDGGATNNGSLTVPTALSGGTVTNAGTGTLTLGGTNTATLSNGGTSTVVYNGAAGNQAIDIVPYFNLTLSGAATKSAATALTIAHNTELSGGILTLTAGTSTTDTLSLNGTGQAAGIFTAATNPTVLAGAGSLVVSLSSVPVPVPVIVVDDSSSSHVVGSSRRNVPNPTTAVPSVTADGQVLCPNGMTAASNCTLMPVMGPGLCPNGSTIASNCVLISSTTIIVPAPTGPFFYDFGTVTVKPGSSGAACSAWQNFFNVHRNAGLVVDGKCGPLTMGAARAWQLASGLVADGLLGPKSRAEANRQAALQ